MMEQGFLNFGFPYLIICIVSSLAWVLVVLIPTIKRIFKNENLSEKEKNVYLALLFLIPIVGFLAYNLKAQRDIRKRYLPKAR